MKILKFESLDKIDNGSVALAVDQALHQMWLDCEDRPTLEKPRKVNLDQLSLLEGDDEAD